MNNFGIWLWETRVGAGVRGFIFTGLPTFILIFIYITLNKSNNIALLGTGFALAVLGGGLFYILRGEDDVSQIG